MDEDKDISMKAEYINLNKEKVRCPNCYKFVKMEVEDNTATTDLGLVGTIYYYCPKCNTEVGETWG